jgi:hypothetical protein
MYSACKKSLYQTLEQSKGMKKEKWVKAGRCRLTL